MTDDILTPAALASGRRKVLGKLASALGAVAVAQDSAAATTPPQQPPRRPIRVPRRPQPAAPIPGPPNAVAWLTRATFGFTPAALAAFNALGSTDADRWSAWVAQQIDPSSLDDKACDSRISAAKFVTLNLTEAQLWAQYHSPATAIDYNVRMLPIAEVERMTLIRQTYSQRQLFEVMVDFWHDHFSVNGWDYDAGPMFSAFDALFRDTSAGNGVFGNFQNLLMAVGQSASMMFMLDLYSNIAAGPNENYARELCELHALGAENYAGVVDPDPNTGTYDLPVGTAADGSSIRLQYVDNDVYAATTALTGWTISQSTWQTQNDANPGTFEFTDALHYNKVPTSFLNRYIAANTHQQAGVDVYNWLGAHPGVAHFIAGKMCRRLVSDTPSSALISSVAQVFVQNYQAQNQLQLVTQAILASAEFQQSWASKMKRPGAAMVSALRVLDADFNPAPDNGTWSTTDAVIYALQLTGHRLFYWPAPNGYPDTLTAWSSTGTLGMTLNLLSQLVETTQDRNTQGSPFIADIQGQTLNAIPTAASRTAANIAALWCTRILGYQAENVYNAAVDLLRQNAQPGDALDLTTDTWNVGDLSKHYTQSRLRAMVALILCSPDFLTR
jgi:uncharacterized protein (DUF1800 family)